MSLHKSSGLHRMPKLGGMYRAHFDGSKMPEEHWKNKMDPRGRIEFEIATMRQRIADIERLTNEGAIDGKPINAIIRRNWHRGTRKKIKKILELVKRYSGDSEGFLEELRYMEQSTLGGEELTGNAKRCDK